MPLFQVEIDAGGLNILLEEPQGSSRRCGGGMDT